MMIGEQGMRFDGSGRMTANEIANAYGERIVAGASQLMGDPGSYREVFPSFLTPSYYGYYNWQTAEYVVVTRRGDRPVRRRSRAARSARQS
jgi:hypothetical protein